MTPQSPEPGNTYGLLKQYIATRPTTPVPTVHPPSTPRLSSLAAAPLASDKAFKLWQRLRKVPLPVLLFSLLLVGGIFFTWHSLSQSSTHSSTVVSQAFTSIQTKSTAGNSTKATATPEITSALSLEVYIVGAVKHPGVYTLPAPARVYQLVKAAGGPLSNANLVALNLAAKLNDGQEVYVPAIGEPIPAGLSTAPAPASTKQLVNINTASADTLHQELNIGATTAQHIVTYRLTHGDFTSIDQLLNVVSQSIYNKIKDQVTLS